MSRSLAVLFLFAAGCVTTPTGTEAMGQRIRVRIAGRGQEPSITSAEHRIFLVLRRPDGRTVPMRMHSPQYDESEGLCGSIGVRAESLLDLSESTFAESLHGAAPLVHDLVLPPGHTVVGAPGAFFVCRQVAGTNRFVAEADPEIRLGQITADGSRYVELTPGRGIEVTYETDPPGWPPVLHRASELPR
jgi:hypothetical protein